MNDEVKKKLLICIGLFNYLFLIILCLNLLIFYRNWTSVFIAFIVVLYTNIFDKIFLSQYKI